MSDRPALQAARDGTIVAPLPHNAVLAVSGDDATSFLHGQLTNDVQGLAIGAAQWNGWCSPKGRLLAFFLLARQPDRYLLMLPCEISAAIAKRLRMYVLRSKVKIDEATGLEATGLAGRDAASLVAASFGEAPAPMRAIDKDAAACIALGGERFVLIAPAEPSARARQSWAARAMLAGPAEWDWTSIRAGIPSVVAKTQEEFVPQMANLDVVGGLSFRKGCYPGQEIVARTQYRGILKKRMARAHVEGAEPQPGDPVYTPAFGDQAAGTIVSSAPAPEGGHEVLVVAQLEGIASGDLALGSPAGPKLRLLELPYSIAPAA
ncbi:MAG TPA: folate-binding protein [Usitatibacter sp.]|nr:folate-binding protein [Usitatibacter sp.]